MPRPAATRDLFQRPSRRRELDRYLEPSEDAITAAVIEHWRVFGVEGSLVASIPNKRAFGQAGLTKGLPDLLVLSPQLGALTGYIEQKRGKGGKLSDAQIDIGELIRERGAPYAVCCGRDEPIAQLKSWGLSVNDRDLFSSEL